MPFRVVWRPAALDQLIELVAYVAQRNPQAATDLRDDLWHAPDSLTHNPVIIHKHSPYVEGQHEIVVRPNYIVLYELDKEKMLATVTAVYHARQRR
jgi:plasmid stabilization system protein ParE